MTRPTCDTSVLVAATALHHDLELLPRDVRARATYDAVGVRHTLV